MTCFMNRDDVAIVMQCELSLRVSWRCVHRKLEVQWLYAGDLLAHQASIVPLPYPPAIR
jgi:hypothetical protein